MKAHPRLTRKGNVCLIITSVDRPRGVVTVEVTDHSMSTNPGLVGRIYSVSSLVVMMTVRFPIEGSFDSIQHHQVKNIAELEVGDKINAYIFHDEALREIIIVSAAEERFLRNELERFGNGANQKKPHPKSRQQKPAPKAATTRDAEGVSSGYDLAQAFTEDDGPRREDVVSVEEVPDIREGRGHHQPAPRRQDRRRQQQRPHQRSEAA